MTGDNRNETGGPKNIFFSGKGIIATILILIAFFLRWKFALPGWGLILFGLIIVLIYVGIPFLVNKKFPKFEKEILLNLQKNKKENLLKLYNNNLFLRLFAPNHLMKNKLAFIYLQTGKYELSYKLYREVFSITNDKNDVALLSGLGEAGYNSGDFEGAIVAYKILYNHQQNLPKIIHNLAHALVLLKKDVDYAIKLCDNGLKDNNNGQWKEALLLTKLEGLLLKKKYEEVENEINKFDIEKIPSNLKSRYYLLKGKLFYKNKELIKAKEQFNKAITYAESIIIEKEAKKMLQETDKG